MFIFGIPRTFGKSMYRTHPIALSEGEGIRPIRIGACLPLRLERREADSAALEYTQAVTASVQMDECRFTGFAKLPNMCLGG